MDPRPVVLLGSRKAQHQNVPDVPLCSLNIHLMARMSMAMPDKTRNTDVVTCTSRLGHYVHVTCM
jgi:hypothetical protein